MYNQYSASSGLYSAQLNNKSTKNIHQYRFEQTHPFQRVKDSKTIQWNIEESKENSNLRKDRPVTVAYRQYPKSEFNGYSTTDYNSKKDWTSSNNDLYRTKNSKSNKNSKFSNTIDNDYQTSKKGYNTLQDFKYQTKKDNLRSITKSLGSNAKLNDILPNFKIQDYKLKESTQKSLKKLQSCKSETRIKMDIEQNLTKSRKDIKQIPKSPCNNNIIKSYKQIAEYMSDHTFSKKEDKNIPVFSTFNSKTTKNITSQQPVFRPKNQKICSYNESSHQEYDLSKFKKHNTADMARSPSSSGLTGKKGTLSINDFEIGKCKGQGAFGQVFLAVHKKTKMLVALKKVPKEKVKYMLDQFINEIKIQLYLDHPNIVKLFGFFDDATHFYIIMEYMEGGSLYSLVKKQKNLTESDTIEKMKDICLGLKEMHDNSILHRDIKPQNIVLTHNVCKLCDLGWAAICKDRRTTYCGTLDYVSPQIIGGQGYDDSVDIWCLGVLAYQMICGKTPFYNISRKQTMKKIVDVNYEYPSQLTQKSKAFIDKILKKNPDDRIGIDEVLKDPFLQ